MIGELEPTADLDARAIWIAVDGCVLGSEKRRLAAGVTRVRPRALVVAEEFLGLGVVCVALFFLAEGARMRLEAAAREFDWVFDVEHFVE